jgi:Fe2+ transport system protein B
MKLPPDVLMAVVDATNLRLGLRLVLELQQLGRPMVLALNQAGRCAATRHSASIMPACHKPSACRW